MTYFMISWLCLLIFVLPKYLALQSLDCERTRWWLFQKRVLYTKLDITVLSSNKALHVRKKIEKSSNIRVQRASKSKHKNQAIDAWERNTTKTNEPRSAN